MPARVMIGNFWCVMVKFNGKNCVFFTRGDYDAQLFHHLQRFPVHPTCGVQPNGDERMGRGVHVFYLRIPVRVCVCELRGTEKTVA